MRAFSFQSTYSVAANHGTVNRRGALTIAGLTYSIAQAEPGKFLEVAEDGSVLSTSIDKLVAGGITGEGGRGNYCPNGPVTRGRMTILLVRAFGL